MHQCSVVATCTLMQVYTGLLERLSLVISVHADWTRGSQDECMHQRENSLVSDSTAGLSVCGRVQGATPDSSSRRHCSRSEQGTEQYYYHYYVYY